MFYTISKQYSDNITKIALIKINDLTTVLVNQIGGEDIIKKMDINNFIIINKNKDDEIINVDFNIINCNNLLEETAQGVQNKIKMLEQGNLSFLNYVENDFVNHKKSGLFMNIPLGTTSNNALLSNMGPRIPVRIKFTGSILSSVEVVIKDYGINNALVQIYFNYNFSHIIYYPLTKKETNNDYQILVAARIIQGKVPNLYNQSINEKSLSQVIPIN